MALFVLAIFKRVVGEKILALRLRTSATCPRLPSCLSVSLRNGHLDRKIICENRVHTEQRQNTKRKQEASQLSAEKESRAPAAFQSGAFSLLPPGSNCLFCSLNVLWPYCRQVVSAVILVFLTRSVGDEISSPWLWPAPAVKMPEAVVLPVSHIPSFGRHCCPGGLRPVPADGDSSSSSSGPISSSVFSDLKYTPDGMSGLGEQGLQCCMVSTGLTVTCAWAASSRLRFSTYFLVTASSSSGSFPLSPSTKSIVFC